MIMGLSRKNVLVGIALVAVVSGLALGSGAFTQVEATRGVDLGVNGDSSALLAFSAGDGADGIIQNQTADSGAKVISFNQTNLNENATTRFDRALNVTNNGDDPVALSVSGTEESLDIQIAGNNTAIGPSQSITIGSANSQHFDVVIDTNGANDFPDSVTFTANSTSS
jgi:hypothetical protein